jgi:hypothetical protein
MTNSAHRASDPVYRTVLVPLDGSHLADGALPTTARALAARFDATVHTVTVAISDLDLRRVRADERGLPIAAASADALRMQLTFVVGSAAAEIVHMSTAPAVVVPTQTMPIQTVEV